MKLFSSSLRKASLSTHNEQIYKNTVPLPVKIYEEKACNYMKWTVAKTLKLKLGLAKAVVVSLHTPLSQTVAIISRVWLPTTASSPPFLSPISTAEWAKITDARKADKWMQGPSSPVPRQSEPLPKHAWKLVRRQRHKDSIFVRENGFHVETTQEKNSTLARV